MAKLKVVLILIFLSGAGLRLADVFRPIDQPSWREADVGAIARNFAVESMNPFYPRIDWRGTSPGFVEMEFPLYPYLIAVSYKIFGVEDHIGRIWSFGFSLLTLLFFFKLAREYLDNGFLLLAFAFFAFNSLMVEASTAIQPESLMILLYTASVYFFLRWLRGDNEKDFWAAAVLTSLTLLAKLTAAHIGLFFGVLLWQKFGFKLFRETKVWLFGLVTLVPAALWYLHAKALWKNYGNSLGVSNEYHWLGADFLTNPYFIKGILRSEFVAVWAIFGLIIGLWAVFDGFREKGVRDSLIWLGACFIFYIVTARTSADDWASYYHIFSVAPAAILFGFGVHRVWAYLQSFTNFFAEHMRAQKMAKTFVVLTAFFSMVGVFLFSAKQIRAKWLENRLTDESSVCARRIKPLLSEEGLILVSGDRCFDEDGYAVANNASFMFYWLERKGFNICVEDQSVKKVREFAAQGAKYFVAQKYYLNKRPGVEASLRREFALIAECEGFLVFVIRP